MQLELEYDHLTLDELCGLDNSLDPYLWNVALICSGKYRFNLDFSNPERGSSVTPRLSCLHSTGAPSEGKELFDEELVRLTRLLVSASGAEVMKYLGMKWGNARSGSSMEISQRWSPAKVAEVMRNVVPPFEYVNVVSLDRKISNPGPFLVRYELVPQEVYLRAVATLPEEKRVNASQG